MDQKTYVAREGWTTYQPATRRPDGPGQKVTTEQVRLLTSQTDMAARTEVSEVVVFVREAERLANVAFGSSAKQFRILVQFNCKPSGHEVTMAHDGNASQELLQVYHEAVLAAKKLPVRGGDVSFQLEFSVSP